MTDFAPQPLPDWRRAVLKIGSSLLAGDGGLDPVHARGLAAFIAAARAQGREVVLVSSGAVAAGRGTCPACGWEIPGRFEAQPGDFGRRRVPVRLRGR